jgi:CheY-like chemotaxis protein
LADVNQLQQVLINLSLNARDAMPQPRPIRYCLRHCVFPGNIPAFPQNIPAGEYLLVEVIDQGAGMSHEVLAQALDPFFTTKEVGQGTGLGLAVAFGIMTGHQGFLTIESQPDSGTRVGLYLPRLAQKPAKPVDVGITILEPEAVKARHILVIDDESAVQDVIRRYLEIAGHQVLCAQSGAQALTLLPHMSIDLIVLDWMIPKEEGRSNVRTLRQTLPQVPILVCTGLAQSDQTADLLRDSGVEVLRKPFRMNELWHAVNNALPRDV